MEQQQNAGIDYGYGTMNIDLINGIRYGVINQSEVLQTWADESEPFYALSCIECQKDMEEDPFICEHCGHEHESEDFDFAEPLSFTYDSEGYKAESDDYGDILITKSPYYSFAQFCSPCAPGAGYIINECEDGVKTYCFGHDWFEGEKAPYTVYSVETGKKVTD